MVFHQPVFVGDEVSCYATIKRIGRSSIAVEIEAWARRGRSGEWVKVTGGLFTYVAVGENRKPRPVPAE